MKLDFQKIYCFSKMRLRFNEVYNQGRKEERIDNLACWSVWPMRPKETFSICVEKNVLHVLYISYLEAYLLLISRGCIVFSIIIKCFPFSFKNVLIFSYFFGHCIARGFIWFSLLIKGFGIIIWNLIDLNPLYLFMTFSWLMLLSKINSC